MASTRRLAAILAADVAGYSRLMRLDEEGTHERFKAHCRELIEPKIREHGGRIVKSTGDGMLVEFASVVAAVLAGVEVQCAMGRRNADPAPDERIVFRIGINVGDVIVEPHDIFGDGVNLAARLEALAEPGGICISEMVYEQIRDKVSFPFEDLGLQKVKNISRPLRAFMLGTEAIATLPFDESAFYGDMPLPNTAATPRLSIVVLPFISLSDHSEKQYLADAITDDVTTDLSRLADMTVISRNTAFTFRNKPVDTRQIGRDLNVRYVLEGSVRFGGNRVRINVQLTDAEADRLVWADRFDHSAEDLFDVQDEVTCRIAVALNLRMIGAEAARAASNPDTLDCILRGRAALYHEDGTTPDRFAEAAEYFERALRLDPQSTDAQALLALTLVGRVLEQMTETADADIARAEFLVERVLNASPSHALAHFAKAQILRARHLYELAIPEYETAIGLNRNWVVAIAALGLCRFFAGDLEQAIPTQELAIRLSPRDPRLPNWYWRIGMVHLLQSRVEQAISWLQRARSANARLSGPRAWLAAAYALDGDTVAAARELAEARRLSHDNRYDTIARYRTAFGSSKTDELTEQTLLTGLRKAGVPDE